MAETARHRPVAIDCLLFQHAGERWLAPASMVVEVVAHFADAAPASFQWRGERLACRGDEGPVRALLVLRDLADDPGGFRAVALAEPPRPCRVGAAQLSAAEDGAPLLDGEPVRLCDPRRLAAPL